MDCVNRTLQDHQLDIFCMSETWLTATVQDRVLVFPGYRILRRDRPAPSEESRRAALSRGGGVAILYRDTLNVTALPVASSGPCGTLCVKVSGGGHRSMTVGVAYRPPSSSLSDSLDDLSNQLHLVTCAGKPFFLLGDFNINLLRPTESCVRRYLAMFSDLNLYQLVTEPTREGLSEPSLIDHVITNVTDLEPAVVEVLTEFIADHRTVVVRPPFQRQRRRPKPFKTRLWRKFNWDAMCLDLLQVDWTSLYEAANVDEKLDAFMSVWWSIADCHCPVVTIVPRSPYCPWLNPISGRLLATPIGGKGGLFRTPLDISDSYRSIFKIQTAFVSPQHDLHF